MPSQATVEKLEQVSDDVFELLKRKGPLCASQISVDLMRPLKDVMIGLHKLKGVGLIESRPDPKMTKEPSEDTAPWGLSRKMKF